MFTEQFVSIDGHVVCVGHRLASTGESRTERVWLAQTRRVRYPSGSEDDWGPTAVVATSARRDGQGPVGHGLRRSGHVSVGRHRPVGHGLNVCQSGDVCIGRQSTETRCTAIAGALCSGIGHWQFNCN